MLVKYCCAGFNPNGPSQHLSEPGARKYAFRYLFQTVLCVIIFENHLWDRVEEDG